MRAWWIDLDELGWGIDRLAVEGSQLGAVRGQAVALVSRLCEGLSWWGGWLNGLCSAGCVCVCGRLIGLVFGCVLCRWAEWADKQLAVLLFPNITRSFDEAYQAFSYVQVSGPQGHEIKHERRFSC
jgi:hypothetical protein